MRWCFFATNRTTWNPRTRSRRISGCAASRAFYAKLGFEPVGGDLGQNWQVLQNGDVTIGHIVLEDPDGNQIMFDQHVPAPGR